ncbi:hypothetical protein [Burkholderia sp. Ac-20365]|uniref:hypothetical protein n=1 Tax=Burkholderia sp. Ac-20365 TaxID=2703897 RepID=UPI00197C9921|nr:hypothetical protein [Burkholderia sp. Ac-20365]MBN3761293.1 hypothetical protein [Burkholderia sp. Ac-20365]
MELEEFIDTAANYLEDAGISYSPTLDAWLESLFRLGLKPHQIVAEYRKANGH